MGFSERFKHLQYWNPNEANQELLYNIPRQLFWRTFASGRERHSPPHWERSFNLIENSISSSLLHMEFLSSRVPMAKLKGVVLLEFCNENTGSSASCINSYVPPSITAITFYSRGHCKSLWMKWFSLIIFAVAKCQYTKIDYDKELIVKI